MNMDRFFAEPGSASLRCWLAGTAAGVRLAGGLDLVLNPLTTSPSPFIIALKAIAGDFGRVALLDRPDIGIHHFRPSEELRVGSTRHQAGDSHRLGPVVHGLKAAGRGFCSRSRDQDLL